ncbi:hypothetical protein [Sphingobium quisquiliarum]
MRGPGACFRSPSSSECADSFRNNVEKLP